MNAAVMEAAGGRCARCGAPASEVDHVVPLARGGGNEVANMRPLCAPCHRAATREAFGGG